MTGRKLSINQWLKQYGIYVVILIFLIFFCAILYVHFSNPELFEEGLNEIYADDTPLLLSSRKLEIPSSRKKSESKGERVCKEAAEKIFKLPFNKIRPDFLKNDKTGRNMEIDVYNDELKLGIEYNGIQHYKYNPYHHKNGEKDFEEQVYRDKLKEKKCADNGIRLIIVPYLVKHNDIEQYIRVKARDIGILV